MKRLNLILSMLFFLFLASSQSGALKSKTASARQFHAGSNLVLNVKAFHAVGDGKTDDTAFFVSALQKLAENKGGTLLIPSGRYVVGDLKIGSGILMKGIGPKPYPVLLKALKARSIIDISSTMVSNSRAVLHDIGIEQLTFRGRSVEDGFSEHTHNITVVGVTNLTMRNVRVEAFQGDGFYAGARLGRTEPVVHNSNIQVSNSIFDGVNSQNRNGISIIDCSHCVLEHNEFSNLSRPNMPGAIDIEPDQMDEIVRDVTVRNNIITNNHGNGGAICAVITMERFGGAAQILIEDNRIQEATNGIMVLWRGDDAISPRPNTPEAVIRGNVVKGVDRALVLDGAAGIAVVNNEFMASRLEAQVGLHFGVRGVSFIGNRFDRMGTDTGQGLVLFGPVVSVNFERNSFGDVGSKKRRGTAIYFARGAAKDVRISGNTFASPNRQTQAAIRSAASVSFSPETNTWTANTLKDEIQVGSFPHQP